MWYCSECGKKNNGKFCTRCGTRFVEVDETVASEESLGEPGTSAKASFVSADESREHAAVPVGDPATEPEETAGPCSAAGLFRSECFSREKKEETAAPAVVSTEAKEPEKSVSAAPAADIGFTLADEPKEEPTVKEAFAAESTEEIKPAAVESSEAELPENPAEAKAADTAMAAPEGAFEPLNEDSCHPLFPRNHEIFAEEEGGSSGYRRSAVKSSLYDREITADEFAGEEPEPVAVPPHRHLEISSEEKEARISKKVLISAGVVCGIVLLALAVLVGSLLIRNQSEEEQPESTGVYYYVSGVEDKAALYEDNSIESKVLAELANGDAVEYLQKENYKFSYVRDKNSGKNGYILTDCLVKNKENVDYGKIENEYENEKSLGYFYVTKTENYLSLYENEDGSGTVKAKLKNADKVSLLEKTNDSYWYVFDYTSAERGYVRTAHLTDSLSKVVGVYSEPKDKTVTGDLYVKGVKSNLPLHAQPYTWAKVRGSLGNGDKVGLIQKTTGSYWYVYGYKLGIYGYVASSYLTSEDPNAPKAPAAGEVFTVKGTTEYLPVLDSGSTEGAEIGQIHNGDDVSVLDASGEKFWYVYIPGIDTKGYVVKDYLSK